MDSETTPTVHHFDVRKISRVERAASEGFYQSIRDNKELWVHFGCATTNVEHMDLILNEAERANLLDIECWVLRTHDHDLDDRPAALLRVKEIWRDFRLIYPLEKSYHKWAYCYTPELYHHDIAKYMIPAHPRFPEFTFAVFTTLRQKVEKMRGDQFNEFLDLLNECRPDTDLPEFNHVECLNLVSDEMYNLFQAFLGEEKPQYPLGKWGHEHGRR